MTGRVPPLVITPSRPSGGDRGPDGSLVATSSAKEVARAWEDFAAGEDVETGVRPEILASWYRCRDRYDVDRSLDVAPGAGGDDARGVDNGVIFTALGGVGALAGQEVERDGAVVTVTDAAGRVLGAWGDPSALRRAELHNLAPWSSWSEECTGTNGMGTALELSGPVTVTGPEHWCQAFHQWACAGISIRDVVTGAPVASINISRWNASLPALEPWLTRAAFHVEKETHRRAVHEADKVVTAFTRRGAHARGASMAMDRGGNVIAANQAAVALLGLAGETPIGAGATGPADRWTPDIAGLPDVVRWAKERARGSAEWTGYARLPVRPGEDTVPLTMRSVVDAHHVVGMLCEFGVQEGEGYEQDDDQTVGSLPRCVIGMRHDRLVLLAPSEIRYAETDRNVVWLVTERGRIQAATRGLDNVERLLAPHGFRRVHRRYLVNLRRVAEIERGIKGELFLIMDARGSQELVPVSRRHAPELRRALGV